MMKYLQKLGKSLMLPVACLPICGILMGIGYALCPATMQGAQGGDIVGFLPKFGFFLVKAGGALIDNMAVLFVIGVGVGMSDDHDGTSALAALASWLMITNLLSVGSVTTIMPSVAENAKKTLAFSAIANPFIGILSGITGTSCYNKFKNTKLPDWMSFFSGKRWYLCIPEQAFDSDRSASRVEQRILVRYGRARRSVPLLGRTYERGRFMEPRYVYVRFLPVYDVRYSRCGAGDGPYSKNRETESSDRSGSFRGALHICLRCYGTL